MVEASHGRCRWLSCFFINRYQGFQRDGFLCPHQTLITSLILIFTIFPDPVRSGCGRTWCVSLSAPAIPRQTPLFIIQRNTRYIIYKQNKLTVTPQQSRHAGLLSACSSIHVLECFSRSFTLIPTYFKSSACDCPSKVKIHVQGTKVYSRA